MKKSFQSGMTLIELIIGLLLSSLLMTALFTIYGTISKTVSYTQSVIVRNRAVAIFQYQWQKDIEGIFAPPYPQKQQKKSEEKKGQTEKKAIVKEADIKEKDKEEKQPLKKIFDATVKDKSVKTLTFITSNPIAVYEKPQIGPKPRMVRVVYRLEVDSKQKDLYRLMRQESDELDFEKFSSNATKQITAYELIGAIKSLTVEYVIGKEEEQEDKTKKKRKIFKTFSEWHSDQRLKEEETQLIPQFIKTMLVIVDPSTKQEHSYSFTSQIMAYNQNIVTVTPVVKPHIIPDNKTQPNSGKTPALSTKQQVAAPSRGLFLPQSPRLGSILNNIGKKM